MGYYKAYYFLYFAAAAAILPFLTLYYQSAGLSGQQIGLLTGIAPVLVLVSGPLWGGLADATRQTRKLLLGSIAAGTVCALLVSLAQSFGSLLLTVSAYAFCVAPILPLVDNNALEALGDQRQQYGRLRLWGSVGWGVSAPLLGILIDRSGLSWAFYSYAILSAVSLFIAWRLPVIQASLGQPFWSGLRLLSTNRQWLIFSGMALLAGMGIAVTNNYLFLYMNDIGSSKTLMGIALAVATISELPVFFFSDRMIGRFGGLGLVLLAIITSGVRALIYSFIQIPWLVLPVQMVQGLTFSALWVGGVSYAKQLAPAGMGSTAQGLFAGLVFGLGAALGGLSGGALYESLGALGMFRWTGIGLMVGLAILSLPQKMAEARTYLR